MARYDTSALRGDKGPNVESYFSRGKATGGRFKNHPQLEGVILEDGMYAGNIEVGDVVARYSDPIEATINLYEQAVKEGNNIPTAQLQGVAYQGTNVTAVYNLTERIVAELEDEQNSCRKVRRAVGTLIERLTEI